MLHVQCQNCGSYDFTIRKNKAALVAGGIFYVLCGLSILAGILSLTIGDLNAMLAGASAAAATGYLAFGMTNGKLLPVRHQCKTCDRILEVADAQLVTSETRKDFGQPLWPRKIWVIMFLLYFAAVMVFGGIQEPSSLVCLIPLALFTLHTAYRIYKARTREELDKLYEDMRD
jgi:hypothetical protein